MNPGTSLPLDGWDADLDTSRALIIEAARAEVDGDDLGVMDIGALQAKLVSDDDFAIVQLETSFTLGLATTGVRIEVNEVGLRTLEVDGTYQVPVKGEAPEGFDRYVVKEALAAGEHRLTWSYVWNPPEDGGEPAPDGVTLVAPKVLGGRSAVRRLQVPDEGASSLVFEGPAPGQLVVAFDGLELPMAGEHPCRAAVPPGTSGEVEIRVTFHSSPVAVTVGRWMP